MAFNWLKKFKGTKKELELCELKAKGWQKRAEDAESAYRGAKREQADAEYHAKAAMAFKDEVMFLRSIVSKMTDHPKGI